MLLVDFPRGANQAKHGQYTQTLPNRATPSTASTVHSWPWGGALNQRLCHPVGYREQTNSFYERYRRWMANATVRRCTCRPEHRDN